MAGIEVTKILFRKLAEYYSETYGKDVLSFAQWMTDKSSLQERKNFLIQYRKERLYK